ncbi:MAG: SpvB/TcaC N-terminal domain-containing protein [Bacteroidota bacterium]
MNETFENTSRGNEASYNRPGNNSFSHVDIPAITLPKGGGAIKGMEEKFQVNVATGTASFAIPLPISPSRQGFQPSLSLAYNSGAGNSPFGIGWNVGNGGISRKTEKELPQYKDEEESDTFLIAGSEDLVPLLELINGQWKRKITTENGSTIFTYRPRIEGSFARIERWVNDLSKDTYWKVTSKDNTTTLYGLTDESRISDPKQPTRIYEWLPCFSFDDKGNCLKYVYKKEDFQFREEDLAKKSRLNEKNRLGNCTQAYLKRVWYGNTIPFRVGDLQLDNDQFMFELVVDYGEHPSIIPVPANIHEETQIWECREDAFSSYRSGFEIRTYRICRRVLMFHHLEELSPNPYLVKSLALQYNHTPNNDASSATLEGFTYLRKLIQQGHKYDAATGVYQTRSLPAMEFDYEGHHWNTAIQAVDPESLVHAPVGLDKPYQWIDLYNEGIAGILSEQGGGWYYKHNLGEGKFAQASLVASKPSFSGLSSALQLHELDGNGKKYAVSLAAEPQGFWGLDSNDEWELFQPFEQLPNINFNDPNTKWIDLNGDGLPDLMVAEETAFRWYPSKGRKGFERSGTVVGALDEEKGPISVFTDPVQSIFLADINGDGLTDIVRIRNGAICYWPNLGYGHFGAKVSMDHAPLFDHSEAFNPAFLRLADIDGSGTTDLVYLGHNDFRIWMNLHGNSWATTPQIIHHFPEINTQVDISVIDFLGFGTACMVYSSPLPSYTGRQMQYMDLMDGRKPHIMVGYRNNCGKEVSFEYKSSTYYYLKDKQAGKKWITPLPFPVHVLSKTVSRDTVAQTRFASEYTYHHGYYDQSEREFRGFGRVEQLDSETYEDFIRQDASNIVEKDLHQDPVRSVNWYHTGAYIEKVKILKQFEQEYFSNTEFKEYHLPDAVILLPDGMTLLDLSPEECREASRSCKSMPIRQEVYAEDNDPRKNIPFTAAEHNGTIRMLQPRGKNKHAVFLVTESESITYTYERNAADPRIGHTFNLEIDELGNVLKSVAVVYPRVWVDDDLPPEVQQAQAKRHLIYTENDLTHDVVTQANYRLRVGCGSRTYEITGVQPTPTAFFFHLADIRNQISICTNLAYHLDSTAGLQQKRLIEHVRALFRKNDLSVLPYQQIDSLGLPHEGYKLALTDDLVDKLYQGKVNPLVLAEGKYRNDITSINEWWIPSGTMELDTAFYMPIKYIDPYLHETKVTYDSNRFLFVKETIDVLQNTARVQQFDYRLLVPVEMQDMNLNLTEVTYDIVGMVVGMAVKGKGNEADDLQNFKADLTQNEIDAFLLNPVYNGAALLQHATSRFIYDLSKIPAVVGSIVREEHHGINPAPKLQYSFEYTSGNGQVLMKKVQAEPGMAMAIDASNQLIALDTSPNLRWIGNGRTILNNKGKPVKQYEPYFSLTHGYEDDSRLVDIGVSPVNYYDVAGRATKTELPNGTFIKVAFDSWFQKSFDQNDTIKTTQWYTDRINRLIDVKLLQAGKDPAKEQEAAEKAAIHDSTPSVVHTDSLGRSFYTITHNKFFEKATQTTTEEKLTTLVELDIENNLKSVTDARGNKVMQYQHSMLGAVCQQISADAGVRWMFAEVMGKTLRTWDERNHQFEFGFDALHRPLWSQVKGGDGLIPLDNRYDLFVYGEEQTNPELNNFRGKAFRQYDTAGLLQIPGYDFKGNPVSATRRFCIDYKNVVNWNQVDPSALLQAEELASVSTFDALNRVKQHLTPDGSLYLPQYNEANLLDKVLVTQNGQSEIFVKNIDYNEKGQRSKIIYGNEVRTNYFYDQETFGLLRVETKNSNHELLQDLNYTFDPVGNITSVTDKNIPTTFFSNQKITGTADYTYDARYQLREATGREHIAQASFGTKDNWDDLPFLKQYSQGDAMAWQNYTQKYQYDASGNITQQRHVVPNGSWTREYDYTPTPGALPSNRLKSTTVGNDTYQYPHHTQHGFITSLPHLQVMNWNFKEELQAVAKQVMLNGTPETTYYVYDGSGQRARKITERQAGAGATPSKKAERMYVGGLEVYRDYDTTGAILLERETYHVMDDTQKVAMIETLTQGNDGSAPRLIRYQLSNHLGSACLELNESGVLISYEEFHPFGTTSYQAINKDIKAAYKRYRYTGMERDEESGLEYHSARYYLPWLGRWLSADPAGQVDGSNLYRYSRNNPLIFLDPSGHASIKGIIEGVKKVVQAANLVLNLQGAIDNSTQPDITDIPDPKSGTEIVKDGGEAVTENDKVGPPPPKKLPKPQPRSRKVVDPKEKEKKIEREHREAAEKVYDEMRKANEEAKRRMELAKLLENAEAAEAAHAAARADAVYGKSNNVTRFQGMASTSINQTADAQAHGQVRLSITIGAGIVGLQAAGNAAILTGSVGVGLVSAPLTVAPVAPVASVFITGYRFVPVLPVAASLVDKLRIVAINNGPRISVFIENQAESIKEMESEAEAVVVVAKRVLHLP